MNVLNKKSVEDIDVRGKKVLIRCDFNVKMENGVITSDKRIVGALPTINYLLSKGAKVILCSHMGKPHAIFTEGFGLDKKEKAKVAALPESEQAAAKAELIEKAKKTGNWKEVEKEGLMNFKRDTMWVSVLDTIFPKGFNADSLRYVPFGNGKQFEMASRQDTTKSGAPLNLFQAQTPYETYIGDLDKQQLLNLKDLQSKLGKYCGLRVGDIEQPNNNAGNWE